MRLNSAGVAVCLVLTFRIFPAHADNPPPPNVSPVVPAALSRFGLLLKGARSLTFTCRFQSNAPSDHVSLIRGYVEKPNKFRVEDIEDGKFYSAVVSDGTTVRVYEASGNRFQQMAALKSYADLSDKNVRAQTTDLLGSEFAPVLMFFSGDPDLARQLQGREGTTYSTSSTSAKGAAVNVVKEQVVVRERLLLGNYGMMSHVTSAGVQYSFDGTSGLLREIQQGYSDRRTNQFRFYFRYQYATFNLGASGLVPQTFTWMPTTDAAVETPSAPGKIGR